MTKKSTHEVAEERKSPAGELAEFFFPSIGNGVSILAASREEALKLASELK